MSEEEIIKMLEHSINTYIENTKVTKVELTTEQVQVLLDLYNKQKEEIERFKNAEEYAKLGKETLLDTIHKQQKEIEELKNIASEFTNRNIDQFSIGEFNFKVKHFKDNYISKDKIRDKIKELESHIWKDGYMTKFDEYAIHYLLELLEEE